MVWEIRISRASCMAGQGLLLGKLVWALTRAKVSGDAVSSRIGEWFGAFAGFLSTIPKKSSTLVEVWFVGSFARNRTKVSLRLLVCWTALDWAARMLS
jgi:hypothetical protein